MFGFGKHAPDARCGLIIDVGSAAVSAALVVSEIDESQPTVVWTHTERCPAHDQFDINERARGIAATVLNISLAVGSTGLQTLAKHDKSLRVQETHVSIAAPWTYTIPKHISYTQETVFTVTNNLLKKLIREAEQQTTEQLSNNAMFETLGLESLGSSTTFVTANGYPVPNPVGQSVDSLTIVRQLIFCQKHIADTVREIHESIVGNSKLTLSSFMQQMVTGVVSNIAPTTTYGVIDMSGDATEVGVVVDGSLVNTAHVSWGHYAVARELSGITLQPVETAVGQLRNAVDTLSSLPEQQQESFTTVQQAFAKKISATIAQASERHELPTHYLVHTDTGLHPFATRMVKQALQHCTKKPCTVSIISEKLIDVVAIPETRLALSVAVFHTHEM